MLPPLLCLRLAIIDSLRLFYLIACAAHNPEKSPPLIRGGGKLANARGSGKQRCGRPFNQAHRVGDQTLICGIYKYQSFFLIVRISF
jgi:hypothetical protein